MNNRKIDMLREIAHAAYAVACADMLPVTDVTVKVSLKARARLSQIIERYVDKPDRLTFDDISDFDMQKFKAKSGEFDCIVNDKKYAGHFSVDVDLGEHTCQLDSATIYELLPNDTYGPEVTDDLLLEFITERIQEHVDSRASEYEEDAMGSAIDYAHDRMSEGD